MELVENKKGEIWRQYRDTPYYFSNYGRVKRRYVKKEKLLSVWTRPSNSSKDKHSKYSVTKVHGKEVKVARCVWECFNGEIPQGYQVHHKNNCHFDNDLSNLEIMLPKDLGKKTGSRIYNRKLIYCEDNGKIYRGTRSAAKDLYVSKQTICDICNGRRLNPIVNVRYMNDGE